MKGMCCCFFAVVILFSFGRFLPDSRVGGRNGMTQGGSNAAVVIADAYVKKIEVD
jgi:putative alpha-1,2-mannosidase